MLKIIRNVLDIPADFPGCVCTIGNFDGIHLGHQALIQKLVLQSRYYDLPSVLITFEPLPHEFFTAHQYVRLTRFKEKHHILQSLDLDYLICLPFNQKMADLPAKNFVQSILMDALKTKIVVVGDDFHFGHKREGDVHTLEAAGLITISLDTYKIVERVSSSAVRNALQKGDLKLTEKLLGRKYTLSGKVCYGDQRGRTIGFPTANISLYRKTAPLRGVYIVKVKWTDKTLYGVANIGIRPTVGGNTSLLEVHLFNFEQTIYGQTLEVEFIKKIRDEKKFASFEELKEQINKDADQARVFWAQKSTHPDSETIK